MNRIRGKVVRVTRSGLFFIMTPENETYICHRKFTESRIKEGVGVYFYPGGMKPIFDDTDNMKYPFAEDCRRFSDLTDEEKGIFSHG